MLDAVPDPGGPFRFQIKLQFLRNATTSMWIDLLAGTAKEAVMDDHTFLLLRQVDDQIRRIELLIEQHRPHHELASIPPAMRGHQAEVADERLREAPRLPARTHDRAILRCDALIRRLLNTVPYDVGPLIGPTRDSRSGPPAARPSVL